MLSRYFYAALFTAVLLSLTGCEKKVEDSETYQEMIRQNEEMRRQNDSIRRMNYNEMMDSNRKHNESLDSLKRITDSLKEHLDKNIRELKTKKY